MSIVIKNLDIPAQGGYVVIMIDSSGAVLKKREKVAGALFTGLDEKIGEARQLPPHGRLIDADKLLAKDRQIYDGTTAVGRRFFILEDEVKEAPTVIEAEE